MQEVDHGSAVSQSEDEILGQDKVVVHRRGNSNAPCVNPKSNAGHELQSRREKRRQGRAHLYRYRYVSQDTVYILAVQYGNTQARMGQRNKRSSLRPVSVVLGGADLSLTDPG